MMSDDLPSPFTFVLHAGKRWMNNFSLKNCCRYFQRRAAELSSQTLLLNALCLAFHLPKN